jgi:hypothetical protein
MSTIRLRVFDPITELPLGDFLVSSVNIDLGLDSSSKWSAKLPSNSNNTSVLTEGNEVKIFDGSTLLLSGIIQSSSVDVQSSTSDIDISGRDSLDGLFDSSPDTMMVIENETILSALHRILTGVNWRVGEIDTLEDPDQVIDLLDLRKSTKVLEQIRSVLSQQDFTLFVLGDEILGDKTINIGKFEVDTGVRFRSPGINYYDKVESFNPIQSLKQGKTINDVVYFLEAIGGQVVDNNGITRVITLYDAWQNDNDLATDPDFPIVEIVPEQRYAVVNREKMPSPGGTWFSAFSGSTTTIRVIGDLIAAGAQNRWMGHSFRAIPGRLKEIQLVIGAVTGDFYNDWAGESMTLWVSNLGTPASYTYDHYNATRILETAYVHPDGLPPLGLLKFDFSSHNIILDWDTIYGFAFGFDTGLDVNSALDINKYAVPLGADAGMGHNRADYANDKTTWIDYGQSIPLKVMTEPIGNAQNRAFEQFQQYAPQRTTANATLDEIKAAGQAMYNECVAYLKDRAEPRFAYSMEATGERLVVPLGGTVAVYGRSETAVQNPATDQVTPVYNKVDEDMIVEKLNLKFGDNKKIGAYSLSQNVRKEEALIVDMYDKSRIDTQREGESIQFLAGFETEKLVESIAAGQNPDTTMSDGSPGLLFTFAYSAPAGKNYAELIGLPFGTASGKRLIVEVVSDPDNDLDVGVVCKISVAGGWNFSNSGSITTYYFWR